MDKFNLDKFLVEHNLTKNSVRLSEAMNVDLRSFTKELKKRLQTEGIKVTLFKESEISSEVEKSVSQNCSEAAIRLQENEIGVERMEVIVNECNTLTLKKIMESYNTPEGTYGPEKLNEWFDSNVTYARPGGVYRSKLTQINATKNIVQVTYNRRKTE